MKKFMFTIGYIIGYLAVVCILSAIFGAIVMWLWNWLVMSLFGVTVIDFWQVWGVIFAMHFIKICFNIAKGRFSNKEYNIN